jgi:hypothetical protein
VGRKAYRVSRKTAGLPKYHEIFGSGFFYLQTDPSIWEIKALRARSGQARQFTKGGLLQLYGKRSRENGEFHSTNLNKKEIL